MDALPTLVPILGVFIGITSISCCMMCKMRQQVQSLEERIQTLSSAPRQIMIQAPQPQPQSQQTYPQQVTVPYSVPSYPYAYPQQQQPQQPQPSAPYTRTVI